MKTKPGPLLALTLLTLLLLGAHAFAVYDPTLGRWLSRDPYKNAEQVLGPNLYAYVVNSPINGMDPDGLHDVTGSGPIAIDDDGTGDRHADRHHQNTTSDPNLNADTDSYVVAPLSSQSDGVRAGNPATASGNGHSIESVVGDFGPAWGEVSIAAARALGIHITFIDGGRNSGPNPVEQVTITVTVHVPDVCHRGSRGSG